MSIGAWLSNTSEIVSARRNTAAGVGTANGKVSRTDSPWRRTSTTTGAAGSAGSAGLVSCVSRAGMVAGGSAGSGSGMRAALAAGAAGLGDDVAGFSILAFSALAGSERFGSAGFCGDGCAFSVSATTGAGGVGLAGVGFPARSQRHDVDDVIVVLAERAYVDLADEFEAQGDILMPALRLDARDGRRQHGLHVGKIELDRRLERERDLIVAALGRNVDQLRQARTCSA